MKTLQWIHSKIIPKQIGPICLIIDVSTQRTTEFLWTQEPIFKVGQEVVKRLIAFGAMLVLF